MLTTIGSILLLLATILFSGSIVARIRAPQRRALVDLVLHLRPRASRDLAGPIFAHGTLFERLLRREFEFLA
jgi:hypothetical protein